MKVTHVIIIMTATVAICALAGDSTNPVANSDAEVAKLQQQVHGLESRVKELERRLEKLESSKPPNSLIETPLAPPGNPATGVQPWTLSPGNDQVPANWIPRQFNGMTFYLVPCSGDSAGVPAPPAVQK